MLQFLQSFFQKKPSSGSYQQMPFQGRQQPRMPRMPSNQGRGMGFNPRGMGGGQRYGGGFNPRGLRGGPFQGGGYNSRGTTGSFTGQSRNMMPPQGMNSPQMMGQNQGGFLSKLLGGSGQAGATGAGGTDLSGMLTNVQSALRMAETAVPMIQQYGPMVKNIPAMLEMVKEFQNLEDVDEDNENDEDVTDVEIDDDLDKEAENISDEDLEAALNGEGKEEEDDIEEIQGNHKPKQSYEKKDSKAKLYI